MSTRGWYEYYVVDHDTNEVSLTMQFYKWGDATPGHAYQELRNLRDATRALHATLPVHHVDHLLQDNIGDACRFLPRGFNVGLFYFLLLRAAEEDSYWRRLLLFDGLSKEENPEYQLGLAVGKQEVLQGFRLAQHHHPMVDRAYFSIAVGILVRRWDECCTKMNFSRWLQYITQPSAKVEMGTLAGQYERPIDCSYLYRLFIHVPRLGCSEQPIDGLELQVCDDRRQTLHGEALLAKEGFESPEDLEPAVSLEEISRNRTVLQSRFWEQSLPRNGYLGP